MSISVSNSVSRISARIPFGKDLRSRRLIGGATWGIGLVVALVWGGLDGASAEGVGYGFAPTVEIAALETGRVLELSVGLHELVSADDVVVRLDPQPLLEEREVAGATLLAVQEDQARQAMTDARRFAEGQENSQVDRARLSSQLQEDLALLETLRERMSLEEDLASTGASSSQAVEEWQRQIRVVEARIAANRHAVSVASDVARSAATRNESAPAMNEWQVVSASRALELIEGRISRFDLHAGIDGQVTWIYRQPGEVVPAGEPIIQVRQQQTQDVVAFLAPSEVVGLEAGGAATVRRATGQVVSGKLVSVGSGPQPLPMKLWRMPTWPEYGVPVQVHLDSPIGPDEAVTVRM